MITDEAKMKKVVVIGGGSGSFVVLRGLKKYNIDITAVVSMFDSGGSTGILRDEFGILPPGDVRRCLLALAKENGDNTLRDLFNFRFDDKCSLHGHNFGNLFLTALIHITGSEVEAIKKAAKILQIKGKVLPVSVSDSNLCAELENGKVIVGETNIDVPKHDANIKIRRVFLEPEAEIYAETKKAIESADLIVIGPGDLYTSVIPNLLVHGMPEALKKSKAKKVYVCNLMTKWGESNNFKASDFAREITNYGEMKLDYIICNKTPFSKEVLKRYEKENAKPVLVDEKVKEFAAKAIQADLVSDPGIIRHDSDKLAKVLTEL